MRGREKGSKSSNHRPAKNNGFMTASEALSLSRRDSGASLIVIGDVLVLDSSLTAPDRELLVHALKERIEGMEVVSTPYPCIYTAMIGSTK